MTDYDKNVQDFLAATGTDVKIELKGRRFAPWVDPEDPRSKMSDCYKVTVSRESKGCSFSYKYYQPENAESPTAYDVLSCLTTNDVGEMADFVEEYGYKIVDRRTFKQAERAWSHCLSEFYNLCLMFCESELCELEEVTA